MNAEYFPIDMCTNTEQIKDLHDVLPWIDVAVFFSYLVIESIDLVNEIMIVYRYLQMISISFHDSHVIVKYDLDISPYKQEEE